MTFAGALTWNKETIEVDATLANPRALSDGGKSELKADVAAEVMNATFAGDVDAGQGSVAGKVDFRTPSARRLAAWAGVDLPKVKGFGAMTMSGTMTSHAGRVAFKKAKLSLDAMNGSGNLELDTTGTLPHVQGDFTLDRLDLNPYLGGGAQGRGSAGGAVPAWSEAALDFSALRSVDADFDFAVDALSVGDMKIGRSALAMVLRGGKLRATLKQLALYGGNGRGTITLDGAKGQPAFALDLNVAGVAAEPFLTDAIGFTKITGTASIVTKITGSGRSQRAWMRSLGGAASIRFEDGAIKGVNLAEIARTIQSALTGTAVGGAAKTDFAELSGTFAIKGGVAANKDLKLLNPFVRLNGGGIVDIGGQSLDYRVEPKAVSSIKGQGGKHELAGIGIPFRIKGPWSNPTYEPDLSGVMSSTVDAILKGENPLKTLKGEGGLGGLLQGLQGDAGEPQEEAPETKDQKPKPAPQNPLDPLKELFGGNR
jgi:AsmA protein